MGGGVLSGDLKGGVRMGDWAAAETADDRRGERSWLSSGLPAGEGEGEGEGEGLGGGAFRGRVNVGLRGLSVRVRAAAFASASAAPTALTASSVSRMSCRTFSARPGDKAARLGVAFADLSSLGDGVFRGLGSLATDGGFISSLRCWYVVEGRGENCWSVVARVDAEREERGRSSSFFESARQRPWVLLPWIWVATSWCSHEHNELAAERGVACSGGSSREILWTGLVCWTTIMGFGIAFLDEVLADIHGCPVSLPGGAAKLGTSSKSREAPSQSSPSFLRRCDISLLMLRPGFDNNIAWLWLASTAAGGDGKGK